MMVSSVPEIQREYWGRSAEGRRSPDHPVVRAVFDPRARYLASLLQTPSSAAALDVGCGNGFLSFALRGQGLRVVGCDASLPMLEGAPTIRVGSDALHLPFPDGSFDLVVESHLLHHVAEPDRAAVLGEMARVSRGPVVAYEPNRNNPLMFLFGLSRRAEWMSLRFSSRYLSQLFEAAGLGAPSVRIEGLLVPNRCPRPALKAMQRLDGTRLARLGFYVRATAGLNHR